MKSDKEYWREAVDEFEKAEQRKDILRAIFCMVIMFFVFIGLSYLAFMAIDQQQIISESLNDVPRTNER